jgi:hypothetical protein
MLSQQQKSPASLSTQRAGRREACSCELVNAIKILRVCLVPV